MTENNHPEQTSLPEEELDVFFGIINRFIGFFTLESQKYSKNDSSSEYPFVPMDTRQMFQQIKLAKTYLDRQPADKPLSFIDIGCGIGNIMLVAEQMDFEVFGIEKDDYPFQIAKKLMGSDKVAATDIWDFEDYNQFDVIYYFRPFHDGPTQKKFELYIEDQLRPWGVLIANRKMSDKINVDKRFKKLSDTLPVWVKIDA